jgi:amino acid adenylation domain-containing protein
MSDQPQYDGIAIVGMAGRFPGADSVDEFWEHLVEGRESVSFFSDAELAESGLDGVALRNRGNYVAARGVLKDADCFDAAFFGVHPKEAEVMDPQQRLFLETCWSALERAGYAPNRVDAVVGVFGGVSFNTFYMHALHPRPDLIELVGAEQVMFGNEKDYVTTRVAYKLGLKGPALSVNTACSTSLVAVAQACQSLLTYQCDMALAGAASVTVPQKRGYFHDEGNIGSSDGHTRTFDAQASGTTFGNGVGVVVLKRLEDAVRDRDQVYAVIKGAALNNDGSNRVSFGAPGVDGQSKVIAMAHALAGVDPKTITYVEAHGTATPLGDPIEVAALTKAFREATDARQFCALGSVKSNVGHLDVAAGVTGLIKTSLALRHKVLPATLHFVKPNAKLDLETSPFYVNATLQEWKALPGTPRRAGVSSFGTGGTNAHLVLEEAPELPSSGPSRRWQLLPLSAKTPEALDRLTAQLSQYLKRLAGQFKSDQAGAALADAAFTLQTGRSIFSHRRIVVSEEPTEGAVALDALDPKRVYTQRQQLSAPPVVFMFPGQGAQYPGMAHGLYRTEPFFRAEVDRCIAILQPVLKTDLLAVIFPREGSEKDAEKLLLQTSLTQPALFVIEYSLARLWMSWGIKPAAMIGHSVGEYVAGCLSGVFKLEDALTLVARRGALVQAQPGGTMLVVRQSEKEVQPLLGPELAIAAVNSPNLCVVAGPYGAVEALEKDLDSRGVVTKRLHTSHAFHSSMMDPVLPPFTELLRKVELRDPEIPYVSNVTAGWISTAEAKDPGYWAGHVRQTVRFADGVAELMKDPRNLLLEVGPGQTLSTLARQHPSKAVDQIVLSSLPMAGAPELRGFFETLGRLWMSGVNIDWESFYRNQQRRKAELPSYPFERKRYWPQPPTAKISVSSVQVAIADRAAAPCAPEEPVTVSSQLEPQASAPRLDRLLAAVRSLLGELSGYDLAEIDPAADLMELGFDSLLLTQASQLLQREFSVAITFRQLMEDLSSIQAIAAYLDAKIPAEAFAPAPSVPVVAPSAIEPAARPAFGNLVLEQLLEQQQLLTSQLLQLLGRQPVSAPPVLSPAPQANAPVAKQENKAHGPFKPFDRTATAAISPAQARALEDLIANYTARTGQSKKLAAQNRPILADPRSASGFNRLWKEMVYPILTTRSDGSKVWDVDGNQYIDFVMGFGASMFGHRPPFVIKAVEEQLDLGFEIGPIQPIAGEVAALIREFIGMDRVAFTNTGSEAVLAATRVARTVTGRNKIAVFAGAYHGIFDEVLFRPLTVNGETRTAPIAPGVPQSAVSEVIVLDYGNPQSLDILRARGSEIAAVLVEPVQSRHLDLQPREFLHELRRLTQEIGSALVFDEVVTGFRVEPGGAQAYFGVRADLATYGKVVGGGLPIGVVAGSPKFMDALDGGQWQYGDSSFPEVGVTFFAGTFVRHPLVLAAAKAVLVHLKQSGPALQATLTAGTARLAEELRAAIAEFQAPYVVTQFSSLIHINYPADQKFAGLLFYLLRLRGIHIWDNRAFILTTAHSDADLELLVRAFRESLAEMRAAGFIASTAIPSSVPAFTAASLQTLPEGSTKGVSATAEDSFPLTEAQKEIWLAAQMGGDAAVAYNESLKLEFRGDFDVELFRKAAQQVVERHPILLASISADGQSQKFQSSSNLTLPLMDFSAQRESEREQRLAAVIETEVSEKFDLITGPLLRVKIVRLASDHHVVVWTAHHIICDGWSGGLIVSELAAIYSALKQDLQPKLDAPQSFRDYALAVQRQSPEKQQAIEYWRRQFAELPPPLDLPADRLRPRIRSAQAATLRKDFELALYQSLKSTSRQQRTTLVVLLLASLKSLIYRLAGQTDLVIGLPAAGQAVTGNTSLVGHCVSLLPIRTQLDPSSTFRQYTSTVKKSVLDAYENHQCTIGEILKYLHVPRNASRPPLVEVIFNVDRDPGSAEFFGTRFSCERNPKRALHFDLFLNFVEGPAGLYLECDYNTSLFDASTIERWLGHYHSLLKGIASNQAESLQNLPLLTEAERHQLMVEWNQNVLQIPRGRTLVQAFEIQAGSTPHARAVSCNGQHLTYEELNHRASQVAHCLIRNGVGPEVLVGLYFERSLDMLVAILGILKAGGAYVPMDPEYPTERVAAILEDARARIVLTQKSLAGKLPSFSGSVINLDQDWPLFAKHSVENPAVSVVPENLAYVLFTSGSTGRPKGVAIEHRAAVAFLEWAGHVYSNQQLAGVLFSTSVCFDLSIFEIFVTLSAGGEVIIAQNALHLPTLPEKDRVTLINTVPSAIAELVRMDGIPKSSKTINLAGEPLPDSLVEQIYAGSSVEKVYNLYGPTECTTYSTFTLVPRGVTVTIGKPIANTRTYILDTNHKPVPVGVAAELYLAGAGLARGYFGRDDLTGERFLVDPFVPGGTERMYRTGDLCRWLPDGNIQYLGRTDHQVKLRGFRIELGEIEATLNRHPSVRQSVVIVREDVPGLQRLAAYVVPHVGAQPQTDELLEHAKRSLPEFMVPSSVCVLDAFPLSPNGKIDRKGLRPPDGLLTQVESRFEAPRDSLEQLLSQLWSKTLNLRRVGIRDNFFDLGGHSLLAVRILMKIEQRLDKRLPLSTLLQAPTVAELADLLRTDNWTPSWSSLVPIRAGGSKPPFFLMHSHGGNILEYYPLANLLDQDQPVYALQARGLDGNIIRGESMQQLAAAYLKEIRSLQPSGPYFLGGFCFGGLLALEAAQQLTTAGEEVALVVMMQSTHPASATFKPTTNALQRLWYRAAKRTSLERENLSYRGPRYLIERLRHALDKAKAWSAIRYHGRNGNGGPVSSSLVPYTLELLSIEHDEVFVRYQPGSYSGKVVLFRSSKQMPGLIADASLGWNQLLGKDLEICVVPGHQQNMLIEPNVHALSRELQRHLEQAQRSVVTSLG